MKIGTIAEYVPPVANVNVSTYTLIDGIVLVVPVKFNALNQLPDDIVGTEAPLINDKLGALVAEPPAVLPKLNVLVVDIALVNPPVPVHVKLVAVSIDKLTAPALENANAILPVPNEILRVLVLIELN